MNTNRSRALTHWLIQRATAFALAPTIFIAPLWLVLISFNIFLFWHIYLGLEEILADYIHNEVTRNLILILLKIIILISIKYVFVLFVLPACPATPLAAL